jgi:hypothetical protein
MPGSSGYWISKAEWAKGPGHADLPLVFLLALGDPGGVAESIVLAAIICFNARNQFFWASFVR